MPVVTSLVSVSYTLNDASRCYVPHLGRRRLSDDAELHVCVSCATDDLLAFLYRALYISDIGIRVLEYYLDTQVFKAFSGYPVFFVSRYSSTVFKADGNLQKKRLNQLHILGTTDTTTICYKNNRLRRNILFVIFGVEYLSARLPRVPRAICATIGK